MNAPDRSDPKALEALLARGVTLRERFRGIPEESVLALGEEFLGRALLLPGAEASVTAKVEAGTALLVHGAIPELAPFLPLIDGGEELGLHVLIVTLQDRAKKAAAAQAKALGP